MIAEHAFKCFRCSEWVDKQTKLTYYLVHICLSYEARVQGGGQASWQQPLIAPQKLDAALVTALSNHLPVLG